ncbi:MAG: hypothetical protein N2234_05110 [Planctomycetota bacterium]|nr:hypothetical protein [Planctomycetota bacterium]
MTGFEIFLLIVALIEFVIVMYLYAAVSKLRESHKVVSEMALDDADAFIASLGRAKEQEDPKDTHLIIEEAERYLTSYRETLKKHYERYSSELTLKDVLPFLKKKKGVVTTVSVEKAVSRIPKAVKKTPIEAPKEKEEAAREEGKEVVEEVVFSPEKSEAPTERADKLSEKEADAIVREALKEAGVEKSETGTTVETEKSEKKIVLKKPQKKIVIKESKETNKKSDEKKEGENDLLPPPD